MSPARKAWQRGQCCLSLAIVFAVVPQSTRGVEFLLALAGYRYGDFRYNL